MSTSTLHLGIFTSPPKEGVLRIFSPLKIRRLRPGLNPRTWVLKASTLPLDHRSRLQEYVKEDTVEVKGPCVDMPEVGISTDRNMQHTCEGNLN